MAGTRSLSPLSTWAGAGRVGGQADVDHLTEARRLDALQLHQFAIRIRQKPAGDIDHLVDVFLALEFVDDRAAHAPYADTG